MLPVRLLLAVLGGVAVWLAFPGFDVWPLAFLGTGALALATAGTRWWVGALAGLGLGLTWFAPMFTWASTYAGTAPWAAMSVASALYPAALGAVLALLQRDGRVRPFVGAAAWVVMEQARAVTPFGGFPWARLGFSQADSPLLGAVALVGVPGLGLLVALVGGLLALGVQRLARARPAPRRTTAWVPVLVAAGLVLVPLLVPRPTAGDPVTVAAVQGDIPEGFTRTLTAERGTMLQRYTEQTTGLAEDVAAGRQEAPDLVLWPEGASDLDPLHPVRGAETTGRIMEAVDAVDAPVVLGGISRQGGEDPYNMMFSYLPGEGLDQVYSKVYLAPFGEFVPLRPLLRHLSPWVDRISDLSAGTEPGTMPVPLPDGRTVDLGLGICFEVVVDPAVRDVVRGGAELLVVPTSNAWFGEGHQSVQHIAASRVRAVEHGRSVVHISNVGVSGLITPDGRVQEPTDLYTRATLVGDLPLRSATTPALHVGPWVAPVAAVVLAGALLRTLLQAARASASARGDRTPAVRLPR
ncbi:apolipoprotein N-acyltransferase [Ornithinimicrobium sp. W1679]|uniref:apolipoprotein N-acyltransferase n=1 Tax=Ornithinimicrobium sp. W1679 TaxID=3418770 RepID=UPI003CFA5C50